MVLTPEETSREEAKILAKFRAALANPDQPFEIDASPDFVFSDRFMGQVQSAMNAVIVAGPPQWHESTEYTSMPPENSYYANPPPHITSNAAGQYRATNLEAYSMDAGYNMTRPGESTQYTAFDPEPQSLNAARRAKAKPKDPSDVSEDSYTPVDPTLTLLNPANKLRLHKTRACRIGRPSQLDKSAVAKGPSNDKPLDTCSRCLQPFDATSPSTHDCEYTLPTKYDCDRAYLRVLESKRTGLPPQELRCEADRLREGRVMARKMYNHIIVNVASMEARLEIHRKYFEGFRVVYAKPDFKWTEEHYHVHGIALLQTDVMLKQSYMMELFLQLQAEMEERLDKKEPPPGSHDAPVQGGAAPDEGRSVHGRGQADPEEARLLYGGTHPTHVHLFRVLKKFFDGPTDTSSTPATGSERDAIAEQEKTADPLEFSSESPRTT